MINAGHKPLTIPGMHRVSSSKSLQQHRSSLLHIREEGWPRYEEGGHNAGKRMTMTADEETRGWVDFSLIGNVNFNKPVIEFFMMSSQKNDVRNITWQMITTYGRALGDFTNTTDAIMAAMIPREQKLYPNLVCE